MTAIPGYNKPRLNQTITAGPNWVCYNWVWLYVILLTFEYFFQQHEDV